LAIHQLPSFPDHTDGVPDKQQKSLEQLLNEIRKKEAAERARPPRDSEQQLDKK